MNKRHYWIELNRVKLFYKIYNFEYLNLWATFKVRENLLKNRPMAELNYYHFGHYILKYKCQFDQFFALSVNIDTQAIV